MFDSLLFTIMDELVWLLPNASGKGREDHTKNMLCARGLLQDVRLDKNGKRQEGGVGMCKEDKKGRGATTLDQSQESTL